MASNRPSANFHQENSISKVLFFSDLPTGCTSEDLSKTCGMFGRVQHIQMLNRPGLGLVEMGSEGEAQSLISFAQSKTLNVLNQRVQVAYAKQRELNRSFDNSLNNPQGGGGSGRVALLTIRNALSPITVSVLEEILRPYGQLLRVIIFEKNDNIMALVEMATADQTRKVVATLKDREIYAGQSQISTSLSHTDTLTVRENSDRSRDFTNPTLPSRLSTSTGTGGMSDASAYRTSAAASTPMQMGLQMMQNLAGVPGMGSMPMGASHVYPGMASAIGQGAGAAPSSSGMPGTTPNNLFLGYPNMMGMMAMNPAAMNPAAMNHMFAAVGSPYGAYPGIVTPGTMPGTAHGAAPGATADSAGTADRSFARYRGSTTGMQGAPGTAGLGLQNTAAGMSAALGGGSTPSSDRFGQGGMRQGGVHAAAGGAHSHGPVVLIHNLPPALVTPRNVFNLACVYGNVSKIRIVSRPKGMIVMVQMQNSAQAANLLSALPNTPVEGHTLSVTPSRHAMLSNDSTNQQSGQETVIFEDFADSSLRRFKDSGPLRTPFRPSSSLYFAGLAPDVTEDQFRAVLAARGAMPIQAITFLTSKEAGSGASTPGHGRKSGFIEFQSISDALVTLMRANNLDDFDPQSIVRLSFSKDGSAQSGPIGAKGYRSGASSADGAHHSGKQRHTGPYQQHAHHRSSGSNYSNYNNSSAMNSADRPESENAAATNDRKRQRSPMVDALSNSSVSNNVHHRPSTYDAANNGANVETPPAPTSHAASEQLDPDEDAQRDYENFREDKYLQESERQLLSRDLHELAGVEKTEALQNGWGASGSGDSSNEVLDPVESHHNDDAQNTSKLQNTGGNVKEESVDAATVLMD